jgi:hypothetical protein
MRALKRSALRFEDWARQGTLSRAKSTLLRLRSALLADSQQVHARALYLVAWHPLRSRARLIKSTIDLASRNSTLTSSAQINCSILLKRYVSPQERGVLLVSFEPELAKLAALLSLSELERRYAIVFVPTWQPFYSAALFRLAARAKQPFWIMPSSTADQVSVLNLALSADHCPFRPPVGSVVLPMHVGRPRPLIYSC